MKFFYFGIIVLLSLFGCKARQFDNAHVAESSKRGQGSCLIKCFNKAYDGEIKFEKMKKDVSKKECMSNYQDVFNYDLPACPHYPAWVSPQQEEDQNAELGTCQIGCQNVVILTSYSVTQKACEKDPGSVFDLLPRCPYTTQWFSPKTNVLGECNLICEGKVYQSLKNVTKEECKQDNIKILFNEIPRCPSQLNWLPPSSSVGSGTTVPVTENSAKGKCHLLCTDTGNTIQATKENVTEKSCKEALSSQLFGSSIPRCPSYTQWVKY